MCEAPWLHSSTAKEEDEALRTGILSWFILFGGSKSGGIWGSRLGQWELLFPVVVRFSVMPWISPGPLTMPTVCLTYEAFWPMNSFFQHNFMHGKSIQ